MKKIFSKIFVALLVLTATFFVIYYAKGYRINLTDKTVVKTGVLNIETQPNRAHFYINEKTKGRTSRTVSLREGLYDLHIWRDDYHDLKYKIEIFAEKSTPISAFMFKTNPEKSTIAEIVEPVISLNTDDENSIAFFLIEAEKSETLNTYILKKYQANTRFWRFNNTISDLFTFSLTPENTVGEIIISPDSKSMILNILGTETLEEGYLNPGTYLISLDAKSILADLSEITSPLEWSADGQSILWNTEEGIMKLNVKAPQEQMLIFSTTENLTILDYEAYVNGDIYILYESENPYVTLSNISSTGQESFVLEKVYYQDENRFLQSWKEKDFINYQPFKNSPQSTLFVGKPTKFLVSKDTQSIFLNTEYASYRYDTEENKYVLINPHRTEFLTFSTDLKNLAFLSIDTNQLGIFIFDKETSNYSIELGSRYVANAVSRAMCTDFAWHKNSQNIYYICQNSLYVTDIQGENTFNLVTEFGENLLVENTRMVINIEKKEDSLLLEEFTIN
jgi:hypothetical protein